MGDSPVRAFTVATVISLLTSEDFAPRSDIEELFALLLGRKTVDLDKLHGTDVLKARRYLLEQHGGLARLKIEAQSEDFEDEIYRFGFLDAVEQLYGVPADQTKHGGDGVYIFVRGLDYT